MTDYLFISAKRFHCQNINKIKSPYEGIRTLSIHFINSSNRSRSLGAVPRESLHISVFLYSVNFPCSKEFHRRPLRENYSLKQVIVHKDLSFSSFRWIILSDYFICLRCENVIVSLDFMGGEHEIKAWSQYLWLCLKHRHETFHENLVTHWYQLQDLIRAKYLQWIRQNMTIGVYKYFSSKLNLFNSRESNLHSCCLS